MKKVNSFEELTINQEILYLHSEKNKWFGRFKGKSNNKYRFDIMKCFEKGKVNHSVRSDFFNTYPRWRIYKLTKKEIEYYKLKLAVVIL